MRTAVIQPVATALLLMALAPSLAAKDAMLSVVGADRVVNALQAAGLEAKPAEVEFLTSVPAATSAVSLKVSHWKQLDPHTTWIQLKCQQTHDCLPFFVLLHHSAGWASSAIGDLADRGNTSPVLRRKNASSLIIRAGSRATLLLQNGGTRITTPVICLENGVLGSKVRVRNASTKHIMTAEVVAGGLVRANY